MIIIFATNNQHKLQELKSLLKKEFQLLSLNDLGCYEDVPENQTTLEGNAAEKAFFIHRKYHYPCFADDTGLEIEALGGKPGVYSARYAGSERDSEANIKKVLKELDGKTNRKARFRTVISFVNLKGIEIQFEGIVNGEILTHKQGSSGFGYDPIFKPDGYNCSFAEMSLEEKNKISHRGEAVRKLVDYIGKL